MAALVVFVGTHQVARSAEVLAVALCVGFIIGLSFAANHRRHEGAVDSGTIDLSWNRVKYFLLIVVLAISSQIIRVLGGWALLYVPLSVAGIILVVVSTKRRDRQK
jgi:hypothetical protein